MNVCGIKPGAWIPGRSVHPLWSGCVLCLPMWEGMGDIVYDYSGHDNYGTFVKMKLSAWEPGICGLSIRFDGNNDYIDCIRSEGATSSLSAFCVFRHESGSLLAHEGLVSRYNESGDRAWFLGVDKDSFVLRAELSSDGTYQSANDVVGSTGLIADEWYNAALTYGESGSKLYLNGVLDGENATAPTSLHTGHRVQVGVVNKTSDSKNLFNGNIAFVAVWDRELTEEEVRVLSADQFVMVRSLLSLEKFMLLPSYLTLPSGRSKIVGAETRLTEVGAENRILAVARR